MIDFLVITTSIIAALMSYILHSECKLSSVASSAIPTAIFSLIFFLFPNILPEEITTTITLVFLGASFIGMTSTKVLPKYYQIVIAGIIFSLIYLNTSIFFSGYGGGLGTTACISVLVTFALRKLYVKIRSD